MPCIVYAFLGSSRQLVVGPVAVTSVLLANGLEGFMPYNSEPNKPDSDGWDATVQTNYNHAAIQIAFLAGCFYTAVGILRMGEGVGGPAATLRCAPLATSAVSHRQRSHGPPLHALVRLSPLQAGSPTSCRPPSSRAS